MMIAFMPRHRRLRAHHHALAPVIFARRRGHDAFIHAVRWRAWRCS
jgi:hypothetical protein